MNLWKCGSDVCKLQAVGVGGAIGLRAIGWEVRLNCFGAPVTLCPKHRLAARECEYDDDSIPPCSTCTGKYEADRLQKIIELIEELAQ